MRRVGVLILGLLLGCGLAPEHDAPELTVIMGQAEAPDVAKKLVAMHRARRMEVDLITQDVLQLAPLVQADLMEDLSAYREVIPTTALPHLVDVGVFDGRLFFMPYRPNVQIAYYHEDKFTAYGLQ